MEPVLLVGIGGAAGSVLRFRLSQLQPVRGIPAGTAIVNITGSAALAVLVFAHAPDDAMALLGTGLLGGYTTFSTFCFETFRLLEGHDYQAALTNTSINIAGSLAGVCGGFLLARWLL